MPKKTPKRYLSRPEFAARIGVKPDTMNRYNLPEPDAWIGKLPGWTEETVDTWNESRPSRSSIYARHAPKGGCPVCGATDPRKHRKGCIHVGIAYAKDGKPLTPPEDDK